ncbi:hypothetical protein LUZ62_016076 [Rhynchospora pubera]|uniref:DUF538 domain-containing protein n=1 Tax=Rhynchospora pubera TaxID=906938 RepID=A0AAV8ES02_9POAL|nr:hypothetical protein LUZ62_058738 [Rhynchospora pubera]KAJ4777367.1 hypothetical protein LUZ62_061624 [Rhynchospora pubera]KAJ4784160.1 hypothetical protein LUZ62_035406 [Rhynchospora pubera]KAJ4803510.1 hypothetical protein LUZ62_016076 [Rhynchospora pubera]
MGSLAVATNEKDTRAGAEIIYGPEECYNHSMELLKALGFPEGVMPLKNLDEAGLVRETGFVWMKQKAPYEHFFKGTNTKVRYDTEVTAYVENGKMKKMTGVKSRQMLLWVPIVEMSVEEGEKIYFKSAVGIGRAFPASAFADEANTKSVEAAAN